MSSANCVSGAKAWKLACRQHLGILFSVMTVVRLLDQCAVNRTSTAAAVRVSWRHETYGMPTYDQSTSELCYSRLS
jgi:hypothetical protein